MRAKNYVKGIIAVAVLYCTATFVAINVTAQTITTDPVGFYKIVLLSNSDTYITVPFTRPPEYQGLIASTAAGNVLSVSNNPGWGYNVWATPSTPNGYYPYYAMMISGTKEGAIYQITSNDVSSLTVVTNLDNPAGVVTAGDKVRIIPFWTLGTVFPGGTGVVTTTLFAQHKTEIVFPNILGVGKNLVPAAVYVYYNNAWRNTSADSKVSYNDAEILPDQYVMARQNGTSPTTTNVAPGQVVMSNIRIPLYMIKTNVATAPQDNYVGLYRPAPQNLNQSGLSNYFVKTTLFAQPKDQLIIYDNTVQKKNKVPAGIYVYYNNGWRNTTADSKVDYGPTNVFLPGLTGVMVRKVTNTVTTATNWVNQANYSN